MLVYPDSSAHKMASRSVVASDSTAKMEPDLREIREAIKAPSELQIISPLPYSFVTV